MKNEELRMMNEEFRACLNFAQPHFEGCFRGYFSVVMRSVSVVMRSVAGYVTNNNRKRDRKEAQKGADKNLKEQNLNRLLALRTKMRVFQNKFWLSFCSVILNVVKDLLLIYAFRRFFACAQNDKMIVALHFDTFPFFISLYSYSLPIPSFNTSIRIGFAPPTKHSTAITIRISPIRRIITLFPVSPSTLTKRVEARKIK